MLKVIAVPNSHCSVFWGVFLNVSVRGPSPLCLHACFQSHNETDLSVEVTWGASP